MNNDFLEIIRHANQAPSGHNTQPWRFSLAENEISIKPDFNVSLPVVDSNNRELYISLGCATENLLIAAGHFGYVAHIVRCGAEEIKVKLTKSSRIVQEVLFYSIEKRQTNRRLYNGKKINSEQLEKLQLICPGENIQIYFAEMGSPFANILTGYITAGNDAQMSDPAFKKELLSWMRFNKKQVRDTGNGLSYKVFGNPPLPGWMAKLIVKRFLKPRTQNKSDIQKIASSSHLVLFTTKHNIVDEWIDLGRILQRFMLTATKSAIACAYLNQPCEVLPLAKEMQKSLPINGEYPMLILRIGYAAPMPYSPRKKIEVLPE